MLLSIEKSKLNQYEIERGWASYATILNRLNAELVLCNNLPSVDPSIWDNIEGWEPEEEDDEFPEIFQYYIISVDRWSRENLIKAGYIVSYSEMLDVDVLMVDHWGTSWDYVLTGCKLVPDTDSDRYIKISIAEEAE